VVSRTWSSFTLIMALRAEPTRRKSISPVDHQEHTRQTDRRTSAQRRLCTWHHGLNAVEGCREAAKLLSRVKLGHRRSHALCREDDGVRHGGVAETVRGMIETRGTYRSSFLRLTFLPMSAASGKLSHSCMPSAPSHTYTHQPNLVGHRGQLALREMSKVTWRERCLSIHRHANSQSP
jgi:hypothetical protein